MFNITSNYTTSINTDHPPDTGIVTRFMDMTVTVSTVIRSYLQFYPERFFSIRLDNAATPCESSAPVPSPSKYNYPLYESTPAVGTTDDHFPEEMIPPDAPESLFPPASLQCFDTSSMVYIPGETEKLDIDTVEIIEGSELANQLGTSGKVRVDNVFYQAETGAIFARLMINEVEQLFTLFYINVETNIKLPVTQYQLDAYLSETKNEYAPHYEFFREALKENSSTQVFGTEANPNTEHQWRRKLLRKVKRREKNLPHYVYPKSMTPVKHYCCNQGVSSVTNKNGIDITEAVKIRMYQQEEKLVSPGGPPLKHQDIESALKHVAKQKSALAASQRHADKLNIHFDKPAKVTLSRRQAETVKLLNDRKVAAKKAGIDLAAQKDIAIEFTTFL